MTKNVIRACSHLASLGTVSRSGADCEHSTCLYMWGSLIKKKMANTGGKIAAQVVDGNYSALP